MGDFTFPKEQRLRKEKNIQELFKKGSSFYLYPFKVIFKAAPDPAAASHQVLISVSKKNFKTAVARNAVKRRVRESYRLNKTELSSALPLRIALIYSHKELLPSKEISDKMVHVLQRISRLCRKGQT